MIVNFELTILRTPRLQGEGSSVMNRVGRRHEAIDEVEIERDVLEAIQAVRKAQMEKNQISERK